MTADVEQDRVQRVVLLEEIGRARPRQTDIDDVLAQYTPPAPERPRTAQAGSDCLELRIDELLAELDQLR
jgi:hypothetical protein